MKFGDLEINCIEPQHLGTEPLYCNSHLIHQLILPSMGHEWGKYTWVALEDIAEALGLIFRRDGHQRYKVYSTNPKFFKYDDDLFLTDYYHRRIKGVPIETWDISQAWNLGRCEAQALQYILRAQYKGTEKEDLEKAIQFLHRAVEEIEEREENSTLPF